MLSAVDSWDILFIFSEILVFCAIIMSLWILIPQIVRLHKNKYADNSTVWIYAFYVICNTIWLVYQTMYIVYQYHDWSINHQSPNKSIEAMLWTQWLGDVLSVAIGVYSWILKIHYNRVRKFKKDNYAEKLILKRAEYHNFYDEEKKAVLAKFNALYDKYPTLCTKVLRLKNGENIHDKLKKCTTTELSVVVTDIMYQLFMVNPNQQYTVSRPQYDLELNEIKNYIGKIYLKYPDVIHESNHLRLDKQQMMGIAPSIRNNKLALNQLKYETYMQDISLVNAWSFLCEIYQNLLKV